MNPLWSKKVQQLTPYVPGEQPKLGHQLIKLNTNENPYPPSPKVKEALKKVVNSDLQLYPDPSGGELKQAIANYYQLNSEQVFVGNGSDEVLALAFMALLKHEKPILFPDISYSFYPVYCKLFEIEYLQVPLAEDFNININDYLQENGGIIFPNPNAPTGCLLALDQISELLKAHPSSLVVVDEAYIDFGGESAVSLINQYPNLLVVQTFSKSRSLAGLRVGFAMGNTELIEALERVKNSFNSYPLDQFALHGAQAAIKDKDYFLQQCQQIIESRNYLSEQLSQLGFTVLDSAANFIFVTHQSLNAENISQHLRKNYIIVRHFKQARIENYLRITIGTQQQCKALVNELNSIIDKYLLSSS